MAIEKNMLRERAKKLPTITDEMWEKVHPIYKELLSEYLGSVDLSRDTKTIYFSIETIWLVCC